MNYWKLFSLVLFVPLSFSCKKDATFGCGERHYYYFEEQIPVSIVPHRIIVGFNDSLSFEEAKQLLAGFSDLEPLNESQFRVTRKQAMPFLKNKFMCAQLEETMQTVAANSDIRFVGHFLTPDEGASLMGITDEFIVSLKDTSMRHDLVQLAASTGTHIARQNSYDGKTYILTVDRGSNGDALEMANHFMETGLFEYTQPNFLNIFKPR